MNYMDVIVLIVLALYALNGLKRGLIRSLMGIVSHLLTLLLVYFFSPVMAAFLRGTGLYETIRASIASSMGIEQAVTGSLPPGPGNPFAELALPEFIKTALFEHNNPEVYQVLNVTTVADFVAGYVANICINVIASALLFFLIGFLMKLILRSSRIVTRLPVIKQANSVGGLALGLLHGVVIIWLLFAVMTLTLTRSAGGIFDELYQSTIALKLFNSNILLYFILKVFY